MAEEQTWTLEEATAGRAPQAPARQQAQPTVERTEQPRPTEQPSEKTWTVEQARGMQPAEQRGALSRAPDDTTTSGLLKGTGTAAIRGLADIPGMFGNLRELVDLGLSYGESKVTGQPFENVMVKNRQLREELKSTPIGQLTASISPPTGEQLARPVLERTGEYKPESEAGKIAQAFGTAAFSGLSPSNKADLVSKGLDITRRAGLVGTGGAAADVTARYTGSLPAALAAGVLAPATASAIPAIARSHLAPTAAAKDVAGMVLREGARDTGATKQALEAADNVLPGITLTAAQKSGDTGIAAIERRLAGEGRLAPAGAQRQDVLDQMKANEEALASGAQTAASKIQQDMYAAYNLTGTAPREMASAQARAIFSALEEQADKAASTLWQNPALQSATMYKNKSLNPIETYIGNLSPTERRAISPEIKDTLTELRGLEGTQFPLDYMQKLRSDVLSKGRAAFKAGDDVVGRTHYELASEIGNVISDVGNISFGGMRAGQNVPEVWQKAVDATRNYHETFNRGFLKSLNKDIDAGISKVPMEATFRAMVSDAKNAQQNFGQLQTATQGAVNRPFSDFMVADLTNNGQRIVSPRQVDDFMGKNAALIDMTPGLRDRLSSIKSAGEANQIASGIMANMQNPQGLVDLFQNNRATINQLTRSSPQDRQYFNMLEQSARRMSKIPPDVGVPLPILDKLAQNRTSDVLYGIASGRIASGLVGAGAFQLAQAEQIIGSPVFSMLAGAAVGNLGRDRISWANDVIDAVLSGRVRERAIEVLQDARTNPALMRELMQRPSPDKVRDLFTPSGMGAVTAPIPEAVEEYYGRQGINIGDRMGRASGGRTMGDIERAADALVRAAENTKKVLGRETEALLNQDDNSIAQALEVANQAI
jgi:hypothetical protein